VHVHGRICRALSGMVRRVAVFLGCEIVIFDHRFLIFGKSYLLHVDYFEFLHFYAR